MVTTPFAQHHLMNNKSNNNRMQHKTISIIIPCFNSEKQIKSLVQKLQQQSIHRLKREIILVDDASTDNTREIIKQFIGVKTIFHAQNMGKGGAVATALKQATGDIIYIQDDDLEYLPKDIPRIVRPILDGRADVVFGSRHLNHKNLYSSRLYYWGGLLIDSLINVYLGSNISDALTGAKALNRKAIKEIMPIRSKGFEIETEITAKVVKSKLQFAEIPISYNPRTHAQGKNIRWHHAFRILVTLLRFG